MSDVPVIELLGGAHDGQVFAVPALPPTFHLAHKEHDIFHKAMEVDYAAEDDDLIILVYRPTGRVTADMHHLYELEPHR